MVVIVDIVVTGIVVVVDIVVICGVNQIPIIHIVSIGGNPVIAMIAMDIGVVVVDTIDCVVVGISRAGIGILKPNPVTIAHVWRRSCWTRRVI